MARKRKEDKLVDLKLSVRKTIKERLEPFKPYSRKLEPKIEEFIIEEENKKKKEEE